MNNVTNVFKTRLKELRGNKNQTETAKEMGISRSALSYYEAGERTPDINVLCTIAKYYNVTADYLLGLSDIPKPDIDSSAICDKLGLNQCAINNLSQIRQAALSTSDNEDEYVDFFLLLQTVNVIISNNNIIKSISKVLFSELEELFDCLWIINERCNSEKEHELLTKYEMSQIEEHLSGLQHGRFTFASDSYLLGLTHKLQALRDSYSKEISELLTEALKTHNLTQNEVLIHLKNCFDKK